MDLKGTFISSPNNKPKWGKEDLPMGCLPFNSQLSSISLHV